MNADPKAFRIVAWADGIALGGAWVLLLLWAFRCRYQMMDDAFIGFRYVDHLLAGNGFVFTPGDRIEGVTNIGWLLWIAPLSAVMGAPAAAKFIGGVCLMAVTGGLFLMARSLPSRHSILLRIGVPWLAACHFESVFFAQAGMETGFLALWLFLFVWAGGNNRSPSLIAVLGAFAFLIHPEAILLYPIAAAMLLLGTIDSWRRYVLPTVLFIGLLALFTLIRYAYFGDILPNTFYAKPADTAGWFHAGKIVNFSWPMRLPVILLAGFGIGRIAVHSPRTAVYTAAVLSTGVLFGVYAAKDWTGVARYTAPYTPIALLLFWYGTLEALTLLKGRFAGIPTRLLAILCLAGLLIMETGDMLNFTSPSYTRRYPGYVMAAESLIGPAKWMNEHLPENTTIATRRIGVLGYYSHRDLFDYCFGLADREVCLLIRKQGLRFDLPTDPALRELWRKRSPEYLLEDLAYIRNIALHGGGTPENFAIAGIHYRLIKTFPLGPGAEWALCRRMTELPLSPDNP